MGKVRQTVDQLTFKFLVSNADAVVCAEDGRTYFVEPHVETITFEDLFKRLTARS